MDLRVSVTSSSSSTDLSSISRILLFLINSFGSSSFSNSSEIPVKYISSALCSIAVTIPQARDILCILASSFWACKDKSCGRFHLLNRPHRQYLLSAHEYPPCQKG